MVFEDSVFSLTNKLVYFTREYLLQIVIFSGLQTGILLPGDLLIRFGITSQTKTLTFC